MADAVPAFARFLPVVFEEIQAPALVNTVQTAPKSIATGLALAILWAVAFSGKAIIVKLAYRHGVDAITLIMLRMLFALPFFLAMSWWAGTVLVPLAPTFYTWWLRSLEYP